MAIRRQKLNRKVDLVIDDNRVVDMPPGWIFTITCEHHGKIKFDFNPYREHARDDIAGHMRNAFWSLRHEIVGYTLKSYEVAGLRRFWNFLDDLDANGEPITRLEHIDRQLIDRYLTWMELQLSTVGKNKGKKLSFSSKMIAFASLKTLLTNRQKLESTAVNQMLTFPRNPFPNARKLNQMREPYSTSEQKQITDALNKDLRTIHERNGQLLSDYQVIIVHLIILGLATGRNLQPLLELRRDSLQEHALPDREFLLTTKRRGYSSHATSLRKTERPSNTQNLSAIPATVGDHFRFLCQLTTPLVTKVAPEDRDFVLLKRVTQQERKGQVVRMKKDDARNGMAKFASRHELKDDRGQPLALSIGRLRPTMATELYRRTRDIRLVQRALGHANVETTVRHYAAKPIEAERDHAILLNDMVSRFTRMEVEGKVLLAADGLIPVSHIKNLLAEGYNTGIARCRNPFRQDESVCKKFLACFTCPNMCVFEDDLWRLFSFYYRLLSERAKIHPTHWVSTYGPIIRRIDSDIASQFPIDKVEEARVKAQKTPHPTWKDPLL